MGQCRPRNELYYVALLASAALFAGTLLTQRHEADTDVSAIAPGVDQEGNRADVSPGDRHLLAERWGRSLCVAVLTGYPAVKRRAYVTRLLRQLRSNTSLPAAYDLHVFCEGACRASLEPHYPGVYHEASNLAQGRGRAGGDDLFSSDRWRYLSENYRRMFEQLFIKEGYDSCVILEDDLLVSPDALLYLRAGSRLMADDTSVFTVSLHNDNSFPPFAANCSHFRRVDHFSGLGFLMSAANYRKYIRESWDSGRDWDATIQRVMTDNRLISVQPEVTRSIHLRDKFIAFPGDVAVPRTIFESLKTCRAYSASYDLRHLEKTIYDEQVARHISDAVVIDNLEDALLYGPAEKLLFPHCKKQRSIDRMLTLRNLWGGDWSNGGVPRGTYRGTLFLRYYTALILIVCEDSPFFRTSNLPQQLSRRTRGESSLFDGILHRLQNDYVVLFGRENQTCAAVCEEKGDTCDIKGLWLINEQCTVMQMYVKECSKCRSHVYRKGNYWKYLPAVEERGRCRQSYPHHLSCHTAEPTTRRICVCS